MIQTWNRYGNTLVGFDLINANSGRIIEEFIFDPIFVCYF